MTLRLNFSPVPNIPFYKLLLKKQFCVIVQVIIKTGVSVVSLDVHCSHTSKDSLSIIIIIIIQGSYP